MVGSSFTCHLEARKYVHDTLRDLGSCECIEEKDTEAIGDLIDRTPT